MGTYSKYKVKRMKKQLQKLHDKDAKTQFLKLRQRPPLTQVVEWKNQTVNWFKNYFMQLYKVMELLFTTFPEGKVAGGMVRFIVRHKLYNNGRFNNKYPDYHLLREFPMDIDFVVLDPTIQNNLEVLYLECEGISVDFVRVREPNVWEVDYSVNALTLDRNGNIDTMIRFGSSEDHKRFLDSTFRSVQDGKTWQINQITPQYVAEYRQEKIITKGYKIDENSGWHRNNSGSFSFHEPPRFIHTFQL